MSTPAITIATASSVLPLLNFTSETDYTVTQKFSAPAADKRPDIEAALRIGQYATDADWRDVAERVLPVICVGSSESDVEAKLTALQKAVDADGAMLTYQAATDREVLKTRIRSAQIVERTVDKIRRENGKIAVDLILYTDGYWFGPKQSPEPAGLSVIPFVKIVGGVEGDLPALTVLTYTSNDASSCLALGIMPNAQEGYDPIDEYDATTAESLTSSYTGIGTAPSFDTNDNRGSSIVLARANIAAASRVRAVSAVGGSGITSAQESTGLSTTGLGAWGCINLGELAVPAGDIPDVTIDSDSGWATPATYISQTTGSLSGDTSLQQQFVVAARVQLTGIRLKAKNNSSSVATRWSVGITDAGGNIVLLDTGLSAAAGHDGVLDVTCAVILSPGTYQLSASAWADYPTLDWYYSSTSVYADGAAYDSELAVPLPGDLLSGDFYFVLTASAEMGFNSTTRIEAKDGSTLYLDNVVRLPAAHGCAVVTRSFAAGQGMRLDSTDSRKPVRPFLVDDLGNYGDTLLGDIETRGTLKLRPGSNTIVGAGSSTGAGTLSCEYYPCYSNMAAGDI